MAQRCGAQSAALPPCGRWRSEHPPRRGHRREGRCRLRLADVAPTKEAWPRSSTLRSAPLPPCGRGRGRARQSQANASMTRAPASRASSSLRRSLSEIFWLSGRGSPGGRRRCGSPQPYRAEGLRRRQPERHGGGPDPGRFRERSDGPGAGQPVGSPAGAESPGASAVLGTSPGRLRAGGARRGRPRKRWSERWGARASHRAFSLTEVAIDERPFGPGSQSSPRN